MTRALGVVVLVLLTVTSSQGQSEAADSCQAHANQKITKFRIAKRHRMENAFSDGQPFPASLHSDLVAILGCKLGN